MSGILKRIQTSFARKMSLRCGRTPVNVLPAQPLVSFTFDDFPASALHVGGKILRQHGMRATYYASVGLMDQEIPAGRAFTGDDLRQAHQDGHELGCHTFSHCHSWDTAPATFESEIARNQRALQDYLPDVRFRSLSYPIAIPRLETKKRAINLFSCCRGGGQTYNLHNTDAGFLSAYFLEKSHGNLEEVKMLIDETCRRKAWLILATHDVTETPSPFGCSVDFFTEIAAHVSSVGALVVPVFEAWNGIRSGQL